ncbi:centromere/kinetochore protein zw10 homolog [Arctopsyche grandis]|uniref:centromere/kinetochore protein zw10 homolog n=1 Tax=Arctopsyche grandis TaxID=121162 RepID=UPI00406D9D35
MDVDTFQPFIIYHSDNTIDLDETIELTTKNINEHKNEIEQYLVKEQSVNINNLAKDCLALLDDSQCITEDVVLFEKKIKDTHIHNLSNTTYELEKIILEVKDVDWNLKIIEQLIDCNEQLTEYMKLKKENDLNAAVTVLSNVTDSLNNPVHGLERLDLYKAVKVNIVLNWDELLNELSHLWKYHITWTEPKADGENCAVVKIRHSEREKRSELFEALISSKLIHVETKKFSNFLLNHIFNKIIHHHTTVKMYHDDNDCLEVAFDPNKKRKPNYEAVLNNLKMVFEYLSENLQLESVDGTCLLNMVGDLICHDFSDTLIRDCLVHTIPNCISELQDYGKVTSQVEDFQLYLSSINFLKTENFSILQYANNIDILFANKTSQYFLESARTILKKDLSNIMSVGTEAVNSNDTSLKCPQLTDDDNLAFFSSFQVSPFRFPLCAISRSVQELLDLVIVMMEQATEASDMCARRLYYTARNVFELYMAIVPLHHKTFLETMPQQVALFHNNCMYLAHHLLMLGPKWKKTLSNRDLNYSIIFCDQVKELRDLASHTLLNHMRIQKKQLLDTIRSSDLYYIATKDSLSENAEQAIRQCIRQLQVLKTVWSGIFPSDIYKRLITCLANLFIEELILKVVVQEDITADVATQLTDLYKIVLNRLPQVYQDDSEIHKNVPVWTKFNELIILLGGNLATIEERWFNGDGPLALQFTPDETKRLVRALFQNTTFRANLLSKIK